MRFTQLLNEKDMTIDDIKKYIKSYKKGETIENKNIKFSQDYKGDKMVFVVRYNGPTTPARLNQDPYGMYIVDTSNKVLHSLGSIPSIPKKEVPEKQIDKDVDNAKKYMF
jgi:hypothetical protein